MGFSTYDLGSISVLGKTSFPWIQGRKDVDTPACLSFQIGCDFWTATLKTFWVSFLYLHNTKHENIQFVLLKGKITKHTKTFKRENHKSKKSLSIKQVLQGCLASMELWKIRADGQLWHASDESSCLGFLRGMYKCFCLWCEFPSFTQFILLALQYITNMIDFSSGKRSPKLSIQLHWHSSCPTFGRSMLPLD